MDERQAASNELLWQLRGQLPEVLCRVVLTREIPEDPFDLLFTKIHNSAYFGYIDLVFPSVKKQIKLFERHSKIPFFVRYRRAIGVRSWSPVEDFRDHSHVLSQLEDLFLVQMGNGLDVHSSVSVFHKEPLDRFAPIGCAAHKIVEFLSVVILDHHSGPVFGACGGDYPLGLVVVETRRFDVTLRIDRR
jgi:hypothetical protein